MVQQHEDAAEKEEEKEENERVRVGGAVVVNVERGNNAIKERKREIRSLRVAMKRG